MKDGYVVHEWEDLGYKGKLISSYPGFELWATDDTGAYKQRWYMTKPDIEQLLIAFDKLEKKT